MRLTLVLLTTACAGLHALAETPEQRIDGHVTRILDGDTLEIRGHAGETIRITLKGIDAPEKSQAFGPEAGQRLRTLVVDRDVQIAPGVKKTSYYSHAILRGSHARSIWPPA